MAGSDKLRYGGRAAGAAPHYGDLAHSRLIILL
jgi:hypothetical protein